MKTIESLINPDKKVYVKMNGADDCKRFFSLAEKEGKTVSEVCPGSAVCAQLDALADEILKGFGGVS